MGSFLRQQTEARSANNTLQAEPEAHSELKAMYSVADLADELGVSTTTIRRLIRIGLLKAHRLGRMFVISKEQLIQYATVIVQVDELLIKQSHEPKGRQLEFQIICRRRPANLRDKEKQFSTLDIV